MENKKEYTEEEKRRIIQAFMNKLEGVYERSLKEVENEPSYMDYGRM